MELPPRFKMSIEHLFEDCIIKAYEAKVEGWPYQPKIKQELPMAEILDDLGYLQVQYPGRQKSLPPTYSITKEGEEAYERIFHKATVKTK